MTKAVWAGGGRAKTKAPVAGLFSFSSSARSSLGLGGFGSFHCREPMSLQLATVNYRGARSLGSPLAAVLLL